MKQELKAYTFDDMLDGDADIDVEYYRKDEVDAVLAEKDAEIRRLKRAMYKAIANWAKVTRLWDESRPVDDFDKWLKVERKCRAKAEAI